MTPNGLMDWAMAVMLAGFAAIVVLYATVSLVALIYCAIALIRERW